VLGRIAAEPNVPDLVGPQRDLRITEVMYNPDGSDDTEFVELKNTGSENYGGPLVTAGGLLFIGATNSDKKFRAFDKSSGAKLWEYTLPAAGNATPSTYEVDGRQFVVISAGGGKWGNPSGGTYVAFALPR
jgi:glucose dehydrogenase